jgi:hypothetical protein
MDPGRRGHVLPTALSRRTMSLSGLRTRTPSRDPLAMGQTSGQRWFHCCTTASTSTAFLCLLEYGSRYTTRTHRCRVGPWRSKHRLDHPRPSTSGSYAAGRRSTPGWPRLEDGRLASEPQRGRPVRAGAESCCRWTGVVRVNVVVACTELNDIRGGLL